MMETAESQFTKILKRDGSAVSFDLDRIVEAIFKAAQAVGGQDKELAVQLAHQVIDQLQAKGDQIPTVEKIQDTIEKTLIESGHAKTAKAFILYRQKRKEVREIRSSFLAIEKTVDQYLQGQVSKPSQINFRGLQKYAADNILSNYALNKLYPPQISEAHRDGLIYIHNLGSPIAGNSIVLNRGENPTALEDILTYLKKLELLSQEWSERLILKDLEETLKLWQSCYQFLRADDRTASFFLFIQKPEILKTLWTELQQDSNLPGLIFKGSFLVEHPVPLPIVLASMSQINTPVLLGILPVKEDLNPPRVNLGTVSLNLKRTAQESTSKKDFYIHLEQHLQIAIDALLVKKKTFEQNLEIGLFPQTQAEIGQEIRGYLSIAPVGLFQTAAEFVQSSSQEILKQSLEILLFLKNRLQSFQDDLLQPLGLDFISSRFSPFYEKESEELHNELIAFTELLPFATLHNKTAQTIQNLSSKKLDSLAWVLPRLS